MREPKILGWNIRKYRDLKGLSQKGLAAKIPMSPDHLSKIECGRMATIGMERLASIARILDVEFHTLFMEDPESTCIKFVLSDANFKSLKRLLGEIVERLGDKK